MSRPALFAMAGGGTGGHVIPALAVARELRKRRHDVVFIGTRAGIEARLVPAEGFPLRWIAIGGLQRLGLARRLRTLWQLPWSTLRVALLFLGRRPAALFSMGGYVAGPPMFAAILLGIPIALMEPNASAGLTSRKLGSRARRVLINFQETAAAFPEGRCELVGMPVREEFFQVAARPEGGALSVLVTGGSGGAETLNRAARESWPLFREWTRESGRAFRMVLQTGRKQWEPYATAFNEAGIEGEVTPFLDRMSDAYADADIVVARSGAGALAELAAAGKPSILVPFPFAADDHQMTNARAMESAGAARVVGDQEFNGRRLFEEVTNLAAATEVLRAMSAAARGMARRAPAARAAAILEEIAGLNAAGDASSGGEIIDRTPESRNNTV